MSDCALKVVQSALFTCQDAMAARASIEGFIVDVTTVDGEYDMIAEDLQALAELRRLVTQTPTLTTPSGEPNLQTLIDDAQDTSSHPFLHVLSEYPKLGKEILTMARSTHAVQQEQEKQILNLQELMRRMADTAKEAEDLERQVAAFDAEVMQADLQLLKHANWQVFDELELAWYSLTTLSFSQGWKRWVAEVEQAFTVAHRDASVAANVGGTSALGQSGEIANSDCEHFAKLLELANSADNEQEEALAEAPAEKLKTPLEWDSTPPCPAALIEDADTKTQDTEALAPNKAAEETKIGTNSTESVSSETAPLLKSPGVSPIQMSEVGAALSTFIALKSPSQWSPESERGG